MDAGIDFLMPVYWGVPGKPDGWSFVGLPPLVEAHTALEKEGLKPPMIGMFFDTSILQWNGFRADGSSYHVDLTTEEGRGWFYAAIRDFFSLDPAGEVGPHRRPADRFPLRSRVREEAGPRAAV